MKLGKSWKYPIPLFSHEDIYTCWPNNTDFNLKNTLQNSWSYLLYGNPEGTSWKCPSLFITCMHLCTNANSIITHTRSLLSILLPFYSWLVHNLHIHVHDIFLGIKPTMLNTWFCNIFSNMRPISVVIYIYVWIAWWQIHDCTPKIEQIMKQEYWYITV